MANADGALRALAHPGRRHVLELLSARERTSGALAADCGWSKPAASQHLKVLREAGLVDVRTDGNRRLYQVRQQGLDDLRMFLDDFWRSRLAGLEAAIRSTR